MNKPLSFYSVKITVEPDVEPGYIVRMENKTHTNIHVIYSANRVAQWIEEELTRWGYTRVPNRARIVKGIDTMIEALQAEEPQPHPDPAYQGIYANKQLYPPAELNLNRKIERLNIHPERDITDPKYFLEGQLNLSNSSDILNSVDLFKGTPLEGL